MVDATSNHSARDRTFDRIGIGELGQITYLLASHSSGGNLRVSSCCGSQSASIDPVAPRDVVLYIVHEEPLECTVETDNQ